jgi:hypothetical protein
MFVVTSLPRMADPGQKCLALAKRMGGSRDDGYGPLVIREALRDPSLPLFLC